MNDESPFDAQVYSGMQYSLSYHTVNNDVNVEFEIHSFFDKTKSWGKKDKQTAILLKHEQLHFDISELYARRLKKAVLEHEFGSDPEKEFELMFDKINDERKEMQRLYDLETHHSNNMDQQRKWETFIRIQLSLYADYN